MRARSCISLCFLVLIEFAYAGYGQATAADHRESEIGLALHFHLSNDCELVAPAQVIKREGYVIVVPDGQSEEWYSPEFGDADYLALPKSTQAGLVKAVKNSGFRVRQDVELTSAAATVSGTLDQASCPGVQQAWSTANDLRNQRRTKFQA